MSHDDFSGTEREQVNDPSTGDAALGGLPGQGTLQVVRGQAGEVVEVLGTWRLADAEEGRDTGHLARALETGEPVPYRGRLDDPGHPDRTEIAVEVKITAVRTYEFDQQQYAGENAAEKTLYSFTVEGAFPEGAEKSG